MSARVRHVAHYTSLPGPLHLLRTYQLGRQIMQEMSKGASYQLPVTDLQSLDKLEKSLQQKEQFHALIIDKKL
jgi:hypothetical protein